MSLKACLQLAALILISCTHPLDSSGPSLTMSPQPCLQLADLSLHRLPGHTAGCCKPTLSPQPCSHWYVSLFPGATRFECGTITYGSLGSSPSKYFGRLSRYQTVASDENSLQASQHFAYNTRVSCSRVHASADSTALPDSIQSSWGRLR